MGENFKYLWLTIFNYGFPKYFRFVLRFTDYFKNTVTFLLQIEQNISNLLPETTFHIFMIKTFCLYKKCRQTYPRTQKKNNNKKHIIFKIHSEYNRVSSVFWYVRVSFWNFLLS